MRTPHSSKLRSGVAFYRIGERPIVVIGKRERSHAQLRDRQLARVERCAEIRHNGLVERTRVNGRMVESIVPTAGVYQTG